MGPGARAWDREGGGEILDHRGVRCWLLAVSGPGWGGDVYLCFDPMFVTAGTGDTVGPEDTLHGTMDTFRDSSQLQLALTWL